MIWTTPSLDPARYREWHILQAYFDDFVAKNPGKLLNDEIAKIHAIKPEEVGFSVSLDLQAVFGIKNKEFVDGWYPFFKTHFFTNDCVNDPVYPGAPEFVNATFKAGAMIVYFTGRNEHEKKKQPGEEQGMRAGSEADLRKNGFPVPNGKNIFLFMKPDIDDDDMEYKGKTIFDIKKMGTVVAAFDNEPKADKFYTDQTGGIVGDLGMCQFPFYGMKKTLQDIPFEPETTVRLSDFRRANSPVKQESVAKIPSGGGGGASMGR